MTAETITPNDDVAALSDRALLERVCRQLDHLDGMVHGLALEIADHGGDIGGIRVKIDQLDPLLPHLPRDLALLDPGGAMRKHFKPRRQPGAVQK